jgi:hypothetical protein
MYPNSDPKWLRFLERKMEWLGVPHISIIFVTLQVFGFLLVFSDPAWFLRLALLPDLAFHGEPWRLVTFLSLPVSMSPLWIIFALLFLYSIINSIEAEWGAFKTTFYILVSVVLTIIFSFVFDYPVTDVSDFSSTLFLAAASLFPEQEINLYFVLAVKMKYLAWLSLAYFAYKLFHGDWQDKLFLITIYSNYFIFFGPSLIFQFRDWKRRRDFRAKWRQ